MTAKNWKTMLVAVLLSSLAACGGAGNVAGDGAGDGTDDSAPPANTAALLSDVDLISVKAGGSADINLDALDPTGRRESFTITSAGSNARASSSDRKIVVAGLAPGKQTVEIASASGLKKTVTVQVYDPLEMDIGGGLLVKYVNTYDSRYINDAWVRAVNTDMQSWHPRGGGDGWYALGSYFRSNWADVNVTRDYAMVLVKDASAGSHLLAAPTGYELIWNTAGSLSKQPGSVWKPTCPSGHVALGVVVSSSLEAPSTEDVRCVKRDHTVPGKVGNRVVGGHGPLDFTVWELTQPDNHLPEEGMAFLPPGTMVAVGGTDQDNVNVDPSIANVLLVDIPVVKTGGSRDFEPKLTGFAPFEPRVSRAVSGVRVPFPLVTDADPSHTLDWKVRNSPFYTIVREEVYTSGNVLDNRQATLPGQLEYTTEIGWSNETYDKFTREVGMEMSASGDCKFASWEVKLSVKLGWEHSTSSTYTTVERTKYTWPVPAGTYAQVIHVTSQFRVFSEPGHDAGTLPMKSSIMKYLQYPR